MFNLIKYELKGYYKDFIIAAGIIALISAFLLTRINAWSPNSVTGCSFMISFAAGVVVFVWNIKIFSRDMYEDTGYLLCTLPQHGYSILGSKLISSLIQSLVVGAIAFIFNFIVFKSSNMWSVDFSIMLRDITQNINPGFIIFIIVASLFQYFYFLTIIYFSISLSKVAIKKKKMGKMGGFIIFVVISIVLGKVTQVLMDTFPQNININLLSTKSHLFMRGDQMIPVNISVTIFSIVTFVLMFLATSYIIENKLDF